MICVCQLVKDELAFDVDDIVCSVCNPQPPCGVNTPSLSCCWVIESAVAKRFSPSMPHQGARNFEAAVVSGGASTLQQIGAAVVRQLSPLKPRKVKNLFPHEVRMITASDGTGTSFGAMASIGKSERG